MSDIGASGGYLALSTGDGEPAVEVPAGRCHGLVAGPARNQHPAVVEQRGRVVRARRAHGAGGDELGRGRRATHAARAAGAATAVAAAEIRQTSSAYIAKLALIPRV